MVRLPDITVPKWKQQYLKKLGLQGEGANLEVSLGGSNHVDSRLLAATRVLLANGEAEVQGRSPERLGQLNQPLNKENEVAVLRTLSGVASIALSRFSTTEELDEQMLAQGRILQMPREGESADGQVSAPVQPLTPDMQISVRFRLAKKKLLVAALNGLIDQLKAVMADKELKAQSGAAKKGEKPPSATEKGFGKKK